jgi:hypothetical protein
MILRYEMWRPRHRFVAVGVLFRVLMRQARPAPIFRNRKRSSSAFKHGANARATCRWAQYREKREMSSSHEQRVFGTPLSFPKKRRFLRLEANPPAPQSTSSVAGTSPS